MDSNEKDSLRCFQVLPVGDSTHSDVLNVLNNIDAPTSTALLLSLVEKKAFSNPHNIQDSTGTVDMLSAIADYICDGQLERDLARNPNPFLNPPVQKGITPYIMTQIPVQAQVSPYVNSGSYSMHSQLLQSHPMEHDMRQQMLSNDGIRAQLHQTQSKFSPAQLAEMQVQDHMRNDNNVNNMQKQLKLLQRMQQHNPWHQYGINSIPDEISAMQASMQGNMNMPSMHSQSMLMQQGKIMMQQGQMSILPNMGVNVPVNMNATAMNGSIPMNISQMNSMPINNSALQHFQNQRFMTIASMQQHLGLQKNQIGSNNNSLYVRGNQTDGHIQALINNSLRRSNEASNIEYNTNHSNMDNYTSESIALMNPMTMRMTNMLGIDDRKRKIEFQQNSQYIDVVDSDSDSDEGLPLKRQNNISNRR